MPPSPLYLTRVSLSIYVRVVVSMEPAVIPLERELV